MYEALAQPTALPDRGVALNDPGMKKWIEALEGQVGDLKAKLGDTVGKYNSCGKATQ